jgi:hypothetical protein
VLDWVLFGTGMEAAAFRAFGAATRAEARSDKVTSQIARLEDRFERLLLVNAAMWSLLREKTGLTEAALLERVKEVDLTDGRLDGRVAPGGPATCDACGRAFAPRHARCIWCGAERTGGQAFDRAR